MGHAPLSDDDYQAGPLARQSRLGASLLSEVVGHEVLSGYLCKEHAEALASDAAAGLAAVLPLSERERQEAESALSEAQSAYDSSWGTGTDVALMTRLLEQSSSSLAQEAVDIVAPRPSPSVQRRKRTRRAAAAAESRAAAPASAGEGGPRPQRRLVLKAALAKRQRGK